MRRDTVTGRLDGRFLFVMLAAAVVATLPVGAQFESIRIGDTDGAGFGDGISFGATCNGATCYRATNPACSSLANLDGVGVLRNADFVPDLDCNGLLITLGGGDNFDNRSGAEAGDLPDAVRCTGCSNLGSSGADWTDLSLSRTFCQPTFPCPAFPDGDSAVPNEAEFQFDFFVTTANLNINQPVFFNIVFGDYDIVPASITLTPASAVSETLPLDVQPSDGLFQAVSHELIPSDVFTAVAGGWQGVLHVKIDGPNEPYLVVDYVEISTRRINDCNDNDVSDTTDIANGTSVDADGNGVPDECCTRIRISQESAPGAGDFDANVLGCVDPYRTVDTGAGYYGYDGFSFNGPAPALTADRSHLFFILGHDGLSLATVHDTEDASGGRAEMQFDLFGDPDGAVLAITDGPPSTGDEYLAVAGTTFASQHHWTSYTDGILLSDLGGPWSMHAQFAPFTPSIAVIQGLDTWAVYSADGDVIFPALEQERRVRFDCCDRCTPPPADMVGWWPLDETPGFASTASDLARVNNGIHVGALTRSDDLVDGSLRFYDDSTFVYVFDPLDGALDFHTAAADGDFSIDAWIRPETTTPLIQGIVDKTSVESPDWVWGYSFYLREDRLALSLASNAPPAAAVPPVEFLSDPVPDLDDGDWHLVAVTVDRNLDNGVKFYRDGVRVDADDQNPTVIPGDLATSNAGGGSAGSWPLLIGQTGHFHPDAHPLDGHIDEVEIFPHVLTAGAIDAIYRAGEDGKCKENCEVTSSARCCGPDAEITVTLCNHGTRDEMMSWSPGVCPEIDQSVPRIDPLAWPAPGDPVYGPHSVTRGSCVPITVPLDCSVLASGRWLYGIDVLASDPLVPEAPETLTCRQCGVLTDDPAVAWASFPAGGIVSSAPGDPTVMVFELTNPNGGRTFDYELVADPGSPNAASVISLDGLPPGTSVSGAVFVNLGETVPISVSATFDEHDPFAIHEVMLLADVDGLPGMEQMTAATIRSSAPPAHDAALAGGVADSLAVARETNGDLTLDWSSSCSGTGLDFVIYEGSLGGDFSSHAAVSCSTGGATTTTFPPAGGDTYYLAAPRTAIREGSPGTDSGGTPRAESPAGCLPREPPTCE